VARKKSEARNRKKDRGYGMETEKGRQKRAKRKGGKRETGKQSERSGLREWKKKKVSKAEIGRKSLSKREKVRKKIREERKTKERERKWKHLETHIDESKRR
jgi:hypothetical protein